MHTVREEKGRAYPVPLPPLVPSHSPFASKEMGGGGANGRVQVGDMRAPRTLHETYMVREVGARELKRDHDKGEGARGGDGDGDEV